LAPRVGVRAETCLWSVSGLFGQILGWCAGLRFRGVVCSIKQRIGGPSLTRFSDRSGPIFRQDVYATATVLTDHAKSAVRLIDSSPRCDKSGLQKSCRKVDVFCHIFFVGCGGRHFVVVWSSTCNKQSIVYVYGVCFVFLRPFPRAYEMWSFNERNTTSQ
jgi:hypothetical protein